MSNVDDEQLSLKIILLGSSSVGKSSILVRFIKNSFYSNYLSTVGIDFGKKEVDVEIPNRPKEKVELHIWDTAGQERFGSIVRQYYHKSDGVFVVFDLTSKDSLQDAGRWIKEVYEQVGKKIPVYLIGNKLDLTTRTVTEKEAQSKANEFQIKYFAMSAYTGEGVHEAFEKMAVDLATIHYNKKESLENKRLKSLNDKKSKKCC